MNDLDNNLKLLTKEYNQLNYTIDNMDSKQKEIIKFYIKLINFDFDQDLDKKALDVLVDNVVNKVIEPKFEQVQNKEQRIEIRKLLALIKIMSILDNWGFF